MNSSSLVYLHVLFSDPWFGQPFLKMLIKIQCFVSQLSLHFVLAASLYQLYPTIIRFIIERTWDENVCGFKIDKRIVMDVNRARSCLARVCSARTFVQWLIWLYHLYADGDHVQEVETGGEETDEEEVVAVTTVPGAGGTVSAVTSLIIGEETGVKWENTDWILITVYLLVMYRMS